MVRKIFNQVKELVEQVAGFILCGVCFLIVILIFLMIIFPVFPIFLF